MQKKGSKFTNNFTWAWVARVTKVEQKTSQGDPGQDLNLIGHHGARLRGRLWEEPWGLGRVSFSVWFLHPQRWALCSSLWFEKRTSYLETVQVRG